MNKKRVSGVLLHPTSLPGPYGIGDLGTSAYQFIDFLKNSGQSLWQVLPLGPTGYGDSPYACFSSFAGNTLLINLPTLIDWGLLTDDDIREIPDFPKETVDYGWVLHWKPERLKKAAANLLESQGNLYKEYQQFCESHQFWLDDYALFMAIKSFYDKKAKDDGVENSVWFKYWDKDIALREEKALKHWSKQYEQDITMTKVLQFFFFKQWKALRQYANANGISIIGDIPIFVAPDSVDLWANKELFFTDEQAQLTVVAGVPPDYFSETGQLWGNPLYNWDVHKKENYQWWVRRLKGTLELFDIVRLDHFRGLDSYWEIPAGEATAMKGSWKKGPGQSFLQALYNALGEIPIIAEDLGEITQEVFDLRDAFKLPGMKILQFAFDARESGGINADNHFLPHNHSENYVVYTGTHDNNTTRGWYHESSQLEKDLVKAYTNCKNDKDIVWAFIRMAFQSVARYTVIPAQDLLDLGAEARMNIPSTLGNNWDWRLTELPKKAITEKLKQFSTLYGRNY